MRRKMVFISAVGDGLTDLRNVCFDLTREAGLTPAGVLSAIGEVDWAAEIQSSDVLVCLCRSMTESMAHLCRIAVGKHKPILVFVFSPNAGGELNEIRTLIHDAPSGSLVRHVRREDEYYFAKEYLVALQRLSQTFTEPRRGVASGHDVRPQNRFLQRLVHQLESWPVVYRRSEKNPVLKEAIANFFLSLYLPLMIHAPVRRLFFESGSSVAFLSEALARRLEEDWLAASRKPAIETNNILTYIEFVLAQSLDVSLYPAGPPEKRYGATFGQLRRFEDTPGGQIHPIEGDARFLIDEIREHFAQYYAESGILLGATSGIDVSSGVHAGPHCGSLVNTYFKRAMLEAASYDGCPLLLLLDEDKLPRPFIEGSCFSVCDEKMSWEYVCRTAPLALACAFQNEEKALSVIPYLENLGLRDRGQRERQGEDPWCIIVSNDRYHAIHKEWRRAYDGDMTGVTFR